MLSVEPTLTIVNFVSKWQVSCFMSLNLIGSKQFHTQGVPIDLHNCNVYMVLVMHCSHGITSSGGKINLGMLVAE